MRDTMARPDPYPGIACSEGRHTDCGRAMCGCKCHENPCTNFSPPEFTGRWQDWHRGHGCDRDDGKPRTREGAEEIAGILGVEYRK